MNYREENSYNFANLYNSASDIKRLVSTDVASEAITGNLSWSAVWITSSNFCRLEGVGNSRMPLGCLRHVNHEENLNGNIAILFKDVYQQLEPVKMKNVIIRYMEE